MLSDHLLIALKKTLRKKGISYKSAAEELGLSESSIKRLFAEKSFSLVRLEKLCELAEIELSQLIQIAESSLQQTDQLTTEQEQEIVDNPRLLLVGVCLINQFTFDEILNKYAFKKTELIKLFVKLDRINIIEYLPNNRYRLKISRNFHWLSNGPILRFFIQTIVKEYLIDDINNPNNHMHYVWGMLTKSSAQELTKRIQRVIDDYMQLSGKDGQLPMTEKLSSSLFILFKEDWEPKIFKEQWKTNS